MIKKCSLCEKEINDKETPYTFAIGELITTWSSKQIYYGRLCASCFSKLHLEEMDK